MIRSNETNLPNVSRVLYLGYICVFGSEDGVSSEIAQAQVIVIRHVQQGMTR